MAAALLFGLTAAPMAQADPLYSSIPNLDVAGGSREWCSTCEGTYEVFEQITLASPITVSSFDVATSLVYGTSYAGLDGMTLQILDSSLSTLLFSQSTATSLVETTAFNTDIVTGDVSGLTLGAGTYWVGFVVEGPGGMLLQGFTGGNGSGIESNPTTFTNDGGLQSDSNDIGFQFFGAQQSVPEPASITILVVGLIGAGLARRKRL